MIFNYCPITGKKLEQQTPTNIKMVRTYAMGVFYGELDEKSTETVKILKNARRVWKWSGAASLSQLAKERTKDPENCMFPCKVDLIELTSPQGFEVLDVTRDAYISLESVKIWKA